MGYSDLTSNLHVIGTVYISTVVHGRVAPARVQDMECTSYRDKDPQGVRATWVVRSEERYDPSIDKKVSCDGGCPKVL